MPRFTIMLLIASVFAAIIGSIMFSKSSTIAPTTATLPSITTSTGGCQIIALGDSITTGYNLNTEDAYPAQLEALLRKDGYACTVTNAGVSGDTSKWLLDRLNFSLGDTPYQLAILTIGGNDGLQLLPVKDLKQNIDSIINQLKARKIPVILAGMQIPNNAGAYAKEFQSIYPQIAREQNIPLYPFFLEGVALQSKYNLSDGIHPNPTGYQIIAKNLATFIQKSKILHTP